jgi:hypothetical protein
MTGAGAKCHVRFSNQERSSATDNPRSGKSHAEGSLALHDLNVDSTLTYKMEK